MAVAWHTGLMRTARASYQIIVGLFLLVSFASSSLVLWMVTAPVWTTNDGILALLLLSGVYLSAWSLLPTVENRSWVQVGLLILSSGLVYFVLPEGGPGDWLGALLALVGIGLGLVYGLSQLGIGALFGLVLLMVLLFDQASQVGRLLVLSLVGAGALIGGSVVRWNNRQITRRWRQVLSRSYLEKRAGSMLADFGLHFHLALHDLEGKHALYQGMVGLLEQTLNEIRQGETAAWARVESILDLMTRSSHDYRDFSRQLRQRFLTPSNSEQLNGEFELRDFLGGVVEIYRIGTGKSLSYDCPAFRLPLWQRPPLVLILDNTIRNALEAGAERVAIRVSRGEGTWTLQLSNNGPIITACSRCQLASNCDIKHCPHFSLGSSSKPGGTGMGMQAIAVALERINGTLKIRSTESETSFYYDLPALPLEHRA